MVVYGGGSLLFVVVVVEDLMPTSKTKTKKNRRSDGRCARHWVWVISRWIQWRRGSESCLSVCCWSASTWAREQGPWGNASVSLAARAGHQEPLWRGWQSRYDRLCWLWNTHSKLCQDWDLLESLWDYSYNSCLRTPSAEHPLLYTEPAWNPKETREKLVELAFEKYQVPGFFLSKSPVLSAYVVVVVVLSFVSIQQAHLLE